MKRLFPFAFFTALLFVSCSSKTTSLEDVVPMEPEEVLRKSAEAVRTLESADFEGTAEFSQKSIASSINGTASLRGRVQNAQNQVQLAINFSLTGLQAGSEFSGDGSVEVIVASQKEVYLNLGTLTMQPSGTFLNPSAIQNMSGQWWLLPESGSIDQEFGTVAPDPSLLQAQAEIVTVTEDKGAEMLNGSTVYHYKVEVDDQKLLAFLKKQAEQNGEAFDEESVKTSLASMEMGGELWIDTNTFQTKKLLWNITQEDENNGNSKLSFSVVLSNHNAAEPIAPPKDSKPFSPLLFFESSLPVAPAIPTFAEDTSAQEALDSLDPATREMLEQILQGNPTAIPVQ